MSGLRRFLSIKKNKKKVPGTPEKECIQAVCLSAACQMCIDDKHLLKKLSERRQALPWWTRQAQQRDTKCLLCCYDFQES